MTDKLEAGEFTVIATEDDSGIIVRARGRSRAISAEELREMVESDHPVTVR